MASLDFLSIKIPNLLETPYVVQPVALNNQQYFLEYSWNLRQERAYLSIYYKQDGRAIYLLRPRVLINGIEVSKYIHDLEHWGGRLIFVQNIGSNEDDYRIDTLHEYFNLAYFAPEE